MQDTSAAPPSGDFDAGPPFVFGFGFKDGVAAEMRWEEVAASESDYDWIWLHLNMNNEDTRRWIRKQKDIPYAAASALLAGETRPRVTGFGNGLVVNLRGVNLNEGAEPEDMVSIRIWMSEKRVVTTRRRRLKAAQDIRGEIMEGAKIASAGALLARIAGRLTERMTPFVEQIDDRVDEIEDEILTGAGDRLRARLAEARHDAVLMRRFIAPQRDALTRLSQDDSALFDTSVRVDLREVADQVTRLTEEIDAARERAMVLQDQLTDQRAEEMNRNMMVLSVVAAIFLPLGFLTGLFGINVGGMPGVDDPVAFWMVVLACGLIGFGLLIIFRIMKWL
ncbi:zinc transporter ZntB [Hyphococcus flavus]|uniref:Zinc transporter ZntB n=1 Tax=Hyphococcus flavus TaxID=1866326 RepID=A0AAE9ZHW7_9PROT|nr:zinc transporter ZntB [Hyphococcus flavus]WDI31176.1 zinc transporter ZntB [Hyphococcus flavus]